MWGSKFWTRETYQDYQQSLKFLHHLLLVKMIWKYLSWKIPFLALTKKTEQAYPKFWTEKSQHANNNLSQF